MTWHGLPRWMSPLILLVCCPLLHVRSADFSVDDFKQVKLEAERGDLEAQVTLGLMYFLGEGVPQNYGEALKWYRRAADRGNAGEQNNLALMYFNGHGVPRNFIESARWMRSAATNGLPAAQVNFGRMHLEGTDWVSDVQESVALVQVY